MSTVRFCPEAPCTCGNSDNYNGNAEALRKSLCKILELDDALLVEPGHRESTILGDEKNFIKNLHI